MLGRTATSATWSGPFSSAIRRRASSSTIRVNAPIRRPATRRASSSTRPCAEQRRDDLVDQVGRRRPAAARCTPTSDDRPGSAAGHRAEPADRLDREPLQRLVVAVAQRRAASSARNAVERLRRCRGRPGSSSSSSCVVRPTPVADQPREVEVEQRVEGGPLRLLLDQRRGVRVADDRRGRPTGALQRGDGVEVLGERHRQPGRAQRLEERDVPVRASPLVRSSQTAAPR